jgi:hypothetical protein
VSLKCYSLCFQNHVSLLYMCFPFLGPTREQLLTEFVFSLVMYMFIYAGNCIYLAYDTEVMSKMFELLPH